MTLVEPLEQNLVILQTPISLPVIIRSPNYQRTSPHLRTAPNAVLFLVFPGAESGSLSSSTFFFLIPLRDTVAEVGVAFPEAVPEPGVWAGVAEPGVCSCGVRLVFAVERLERFRYDVERCNPYKTDRWVDVRRRRLAGRRWMSG